MYRAHLSKDGFSMNHSESMDNQPSVANALPSMDEEQLEKLFDRVLEGVQEGATFKDMYGISSDTMEEIYAHAYGFYQQGRLDEAESLFRLLCIYDFHNADYALGLGAVFQLKKRYEKALDVYAMAYTIGGGSDERAMFYAGECNLLLRRLGKARLCFETVLEDARDSRFAAKAQAYLDAMAGGAGSKCD
ncbi:Salmonella invasin chaperone [Pandoraea pulmonicola]|uniref:Salmonella invasin chaperone n=4 Tax=Pandoraea pulmonicola TaxID=93221 RepID=A0AAJ4ZAW2_PANPU|nr:Salmonella invasin chaperone [Pandoraea pulmonicola]